MIHVSLDKCFKSAIINNVVLTIVVLVMVLYSSVKKMNIKVDVLVSYISLMGRYY